MAWVPQHCLLDSCSDEHKTLLYTLQQQCSNHYMQRSTKERNND